MMIWMRKMPGPLLVLSAVAGLAACGAHEIAPADLPVREVTGHFTVADGASWFRPCAAAAGDTLWWATFLGPAVAERDSLVAAGRIRPGVPAWLRLAAGLSEPQPAGAGGRGSRFIYVRGIREVRDARPGDCGQ